MEKRKWIKDGKFLTVSYIDIEDMRVYNPTDEQLMAAGYTLYVLPDPSDEDKLKMAKEAKEREAVEYYQSADVSEFTVNGNKMWVGHTSRTCFKRTLDEYTDMGSNEMSYTHNGVAYTFPMKTWMEIFFAVDVYGNEAANVLENHKLAIEQLSTIEEVDAYDFTTGYPQKLSFAYDNPAQRLALAKEKKISDAEAYDTSSAVNEFTYNGVPMWLDKATRDGLHLRLLAEQAAGKSVTTLWFGTMSFEIPITDAFSLLYAIEVYASACYDRTAAHKAAVEALTSIEDIEEYDYTTGYPQKLVFVTNSNENAGEE